MKYLLRLACIFTPFCINHALFCAQRATIAAVPLKDLITAETYTLYARLHTQSNESNTTNTLSSNTSPSPNTSSARASDSHIGIFTSESPRRISLNNQPLHPKLKPLSTPISCQTSPSLKPHVLKQQSQSTPASTEGSPISSPRHIRTPSIRPLPKQADSMTRIELPEIILTVAVRQEASQPARKKTLQRTTSFSPSSSSMSSTPAPTTPTRQVESIFIPEEVLCALESSSSFSEIPSL